MSVHAAAILPARHGSQRLPGKPLLAETGKPLIQHVWERVSQAERLDPVIIATDDARIAAAAEGFGARAQMTDPEHRSGSDRVAEVVRGLPDVAFALNVQGDEPEIDPGDLDRLVERVAVGDVELATLVRPFGPDEEAAWQDPNQVKAVLGSDDRALYFSRAPVPHGPGPEGTWLHVGVYAWRRDALLRFAASEPTALEGRERLEQLRALELGMTIAAVRTTHAALGIDTPSDYARFVERMAAADAGTGRATS